MANLSPSTAPPPRPVPPPVTPHPPPLPGRFRPGDMPPFRIHDPGEGVPAPGGRHRGRSVYRVGGTTSGRMPLTTAQLEEAIAEARKIFGEAAANAASSGLDAVFPTQVTITHTHEPQPVE